MKTTSRLAVAMALLLCACLSLPAQEKGGFLNWVHRKLTTLSNVYDTTYVYQVDLPGVVSPTADLIWTGVNLRRAISYTEGNTSQDFTDLVIVETDLARRRFDKAGFGLSYGSLSLGSTFEIDRHGTKRNKYNNISFVRPRFGISFQYYHVHEYQTGTALVPSLSDLTIDFQSWEPGQMQYLLVDGFYFFNPEHFSYLATTGRNVVQRRSGGSWMASACYSQGEYKYDLVDGIVQEFPDHIGILRTGAFSLGGGYSFNWVPYHREPRGARLDGFRNLTINITFLPRVSLYNHLFVTQYEYLTVEKAAQLFEQEHGPLPNDEDLEMALYEYRIANARVGETARNHSFFSPSLNLSAHVGFIYSWNRFFICATADFERYGFKDLTTITYDPYEDWTFKTHTRGNFYDITARIQFNVRF